MDVTNSGHEQRQNVVLARQTHEHDQALQSGTWCNLKCQSEAFISYSELFARSIYVFTLDIINEKVHKQQAGGLYLTTAITITTTTHVQLSKKPNLHCSQQEAARDRPFYQCVILIADSEALHLGPVTPKATTQNIRAHVFESFPRVTSKYVRGCVHCCLSCTNMLWSRNFPTFSDQMSTQS